jgi:putative ABC transport system permease protein
MPIRETLRVAFAALGANKLRSFLTMLGVVIGVAAVIAMIALGRGAQQSVRDRIASLGTTLLSIQPGQGRGGGSGVAGADRAPLTLDDAEALAERGTLFRAIQPEMQRTLQVQHGNKNANTQVSGVTANYTTVRNYEISAGRMFTEIEDAGRERVAVLGAQVIEDLEIPSAESIVDSDIRIGSLQFKVVGVLASKGAGGGFGNPDDQILVPIQTARFRLMGTENLRAINVLAPSEDQIEATMAEAQKILRREHRLRPGQPDNFQIRNQADFLSTLGETTQIFTVLLASIALISLVVGGIGIMNIMLVSVTERTREIGIRKALGATRRVILLQFLIEAVVLCLFGGAIGIALGAGVAILMRESFGWNTAIAPSSILVSFVFAAAVGILFGVWPARRAASLDPITSLRYE